MLSRFFLVGMAVVCLSEAPAPHGSGTPPLKAPVESGAQPLPWLDPNHPSDWLEEVLNPKPKPKACQPVLTCTQVPPCRVDPEPTAPGQAT
jgi:hypothetical protein